MSLPEKSLLDTVVVPEFNVQENLTSEQIIGLCDELDVLRDRQQRIQRKLLGGTKKRAPAMHFAILGMFTDQPLIMKYPFGKGIRSILHRD